MWTNPLETADLFTFTKETLNGKLHFLCSARKAVAARVETTFLVLISTLKAPNPKLYPYFHSILLLIFGRKSLKQSFVAFKSVSQSYEVKKFWIWRKWCHPWFSFNIFVTFMEELYWSHLLKKFLMENFILCVV